MENEKITLGPYLLKKKIASGGMAEVYLAEELQQPDKKYVIKKLCREFVYDRDFIHLMRLEFETLRRLQHPNIVKAYQWVSEGEDHYIVMEFIDGITLRALLDKVKNIKSTLPIPLALELARQIATGLGYVHSITDETGKALNLLHSDLNPRNILIHRTGQVKLIDFSLAQTQENIAPPQSGKRRGIILYMSPEQAKGEELDPRSDIFSLGILLYEMLIGREPFVGNSPFEVYCQLMTVEITPETLPPAMETGLKKILCLALRKNREERYQNIEQFEKVLKNYLTEYFPAFDKQELAKYLA